MNERVLFILKNFEIGQNITLIKAIDSGHINQTFFVDNGEDQFILQRINNYAFKDVDALMNNIRIVTSFIRNKGHETLDIIPTHDGLLYVKDKDSYYRLYRFIKNTISYETVGDDLSLAESLGSAFGEFHNLLSDLDASLINEVIPDFHNTKKRFRDFSNAYVNSDISKREIAKKEVEYILNHNYTYSKIMDGIKHKEINTRIIHNDPKINNILFDKDNHSIRAIIDLDTVMPGSVLFDIGDAFRSLFSGDNEDNKDTSMLKINIPIYKAYMSAYFKQMKNNLTKKEVELIPYSIYLMTIECGMRFLEDYLRGNIYFHTNYEEHNLVRCRTQIALAEDVLNHLDELNKITKELYDHE